MPKSIQRMARGLSPSSPLMPHVLEMIGYRGYRDKLIDGDEQDCFTGWRKVLNRPRNGWKWIKRKYNKRIRKKAKEELKRN